MLNPFPHLLVFGFFAPTLLRVAAAITMGYSATYFVTHRKSIVAQSYILIGKPPMALIWLGSVTTAATTAALFLGYYTQYAALITGLSALKFAVWAKKYPAAMPLSRSTSLLLLSISLSLLLSGAGAFAIDLPL